MAQRFNTNKSSIINSFFLQYSADVGQNDHMNYQTGISPFPKHDQVVSFHRTELNVVLGLYGQMVAIGEWRDYGISMLKDVAVFSVFRRTAEYPIYRIEKRPKLKGRQGQYSVVGMDGRILKRGDDMRVVLRVLEKKLIRPVT